MGGRHRLASPLVGKAAAWVVEPAMVKLSKHTADEMEGRGILLSYIEAALTSPDRVVRDLTNPALEPLI